MSFREYVQGRTIAIVGPAPVPHDQSAEIDAHDIVYRTSYGFTQPDGAHLEDQNAPMAGWYIPGVFPAGTGTRVDMAFYNGAATRAMAYGLLDPVLADLDWAMTKHQLMNPVAKTNQRWIGNPQHMQQANQVTLMLWDLVNFDPADVTVFGADFYMGNVEDWYATEYVRPDVLLTAEDPTATIGLGEFHDQEEQRRIIRGIREDRGWPNGDDRFLKALYTPPEVHQQLLESQRARYRKTTATV